MTDELILAQTEPGRPFVWPVARGRLLGVQFHACLMLRRRVIPCLDVAEGRVVKPGSTDSPD